MSSMLKALKKNSTIEGASALNESTFFDQEHVLLDIPIMNLAFTGSLRRGLLPGLTMFAGPSKHGKSVLSNVCAKAYMDKYPDAIMLFYDSEFGTPESYFTSLDIDTSRILHMPLLNIQQLKFDIVKQLDMIKKEYPGAKVFIYVDSFGNIASKKEAEDALEGKDKTDMTRAKDLKSLTRIVTPYLRLMNIPMIGVSHSYQTLEIYSKAVMSGGTGLMYSADNVFIMGRQQEKEGKDIVGFNLIMNVEKSRYCKEKSKFPIEMRFDGGMNKYTGMLEVGMSVNYVVKPSNGWYSRVLNGVQEDRKWRAKDTNCTEFWGPLFDDESFHVAVETVYQVSSGKLIHEEVDESESMLDNDGILDSDFEDEYNSDDELLEFEKNNQ